MKILSIVILKLTRRLWNREVVKILGRAYEKRIINSYQLHKLSALFDCTQNIKL